MDEGRKKFTDINEIGFLIFVTYASMPFRAGCMKNIIDTCGNQNEIFTQ